MSFLIDTDICSLHLRGDRRLFSRFNQHLGHLHVSAITVAEMFVWVRRSAASVARRSALQKLLRDVAALNVDVIIGEKFGDIRTSQLATGQFTPEMDLLIAATALVHGLTLVTHNVQDFASVPGLHVIDWLVLCHS